MAEFHVMNCINRRFAKALQRAPELNVRALKADCELATARVSKSLDECGPPPVFRFIDCARTCALNKVILVDALCSPLYTAISHTWGEAAYDVFDCPCASDSSACRIPRFDPHMPCPGLQAHDDLHHRSEVIDGILLMCKRAVAAGSEFVWHDGVCIAQHDDEEVANTIRHMGWVYANASDTIIYLHNVGKPVALLPLEEPYVTRWNRRAWTLQEAILSRRRRYCIKLVHFDDEPPDFLFNMPYQTMEEYYEAKACVCASGNETMASTLSKEFEAKVEQCYENDSCIVVIEEEQFWSHLLSLYTRILYLNQYAVVFSNQNLRKYARWLDGLDSWLSLMQFQFFSFPKLPMVISLCARDRESKHEGDRLNSMLGLAGITDFVAPKNGNFEASTITFLKKIRVQQQQQELLREVLFWVNLDWDEGDTCKRHTWLPSLSRAVIPVCNFMGLESFPIKYEVLENGMLQLVGCIYCITVQFTIRRSKSELSTLPCKNFKKYEQLYTGCKLLEMDLLDNERSGDPGCLALARGSDIQLGKLKCLVHGDVVGDNEAYVERPMIRGQVLEDGNSFSGHLIFAENAFNGVHYTALIIQGEDLRGSPVYKLGVFSVPVHLQRFLFEKKPFLITCLPKLLIN